MCHGQPRAVRATTARCLTPNSWLLFFWLYWLAAGIPAIARFMCTASGVAMPRGRKLKVALGPESLCEWRKNAEQSSSVDHAGRAAVVLTAQSTVTEWGSLSLCLMSLLYPSSVPFNFACMQAWNFPPRRARTRQQRGRRPATRAAARAPHRLRHLLRLRLGTAAARRPRGSETTSEEIGMRR